MQRFGLMDALLGYVGGRFCLGPFRGQGGLCRVPLKRGLYKQT